MPRIMLALAAGLALAAAPALADGPIERDGWASRASAKSYPDLLAALKAAVKAEGMGVVTEAGPTEAAASRGVTIPGNRVVGVFANPYAVEILGLSRAAMIEAPVRFYVTEEPDGTAVLSYKLPSAVFAPYADEGGDRLAEIAAELDTRFATISAVALAE